MKSLSNDQKEQITIYPYESDFCRLIIMKPEAVFPEAVNVTLEALGYKDRLKFNLDKGIFKWSTIHDH